LNSGFIYYALKKEYNYFFNHEYDFKDKIMVTIGPRSRFRIYTTPASYRKVVRDILYPYRAGDDDLAHFCEAVKETDGDEATLRNVKEIVDKMFEDLGDV